MNEISRRLHGKDDSQLQRRESECEADNARTPMAGASVGAHRASDSGKAGISCRVGVPLRRSDPV